MQSATSLSGEHAEDVFARLSEWLESNQSCALIIVTETEGGAVRAPGALLAVSDSDSIGYISGGCIDADVILQARAAIADNKPIALRYGSGSPFVDLPLPCGGAIEVFIAPNPAPDTVKSAYQRLHARQEIKLIVSDDGQISLASDIIRPLGDDLVFSYVPKLRLRIAGRGADALALARVSDAAGYATQLQLVDDEDISAARTAGLFSIERLSAPSELSANSDDRWTAFVLLFHDQDWEIPLLRQALRGPAFYVGAVGSARTHSLRCEALKSTGCSDEEIARVKGPIGLVPSLRDASMLAISVMAEIVSLFPAKSCSRRPRTAILMLAAGASSRFESGDKLLAELSGQTILAHTALSIPDDPDLTRLAVIPENALKRKRILAGFGWQVIENPDADHGQSSTLRVGIQALNEMSSIDQVIVVLADMPFVPPSHIYALRDCADIPGVTCVMSNCSGVLSPPALFKRKHFEALATLSGDRGAKAVFLSLEHGNRTVDLAVQSAVDIDVVADLDRALEFTDA